MYVDSSPTAGLEKGGGSCWTDIEFGPVGMSQAHLPARLPVRPGSRTWRLVLALGAPVALCHEERSTRLRPGELVLWEPSRPGRAAPAAAGRPCRAVVLHLPGDALHVSDRTLESLVSLPLGSDAGPGALLARCVETLTEQRGSALASPQAMSLGMALLHLCTAFLTSLAQDAAQSPGTMLLSEIKTYVDCHLPDPGLSPSALASAHHISVRYLHHLFRQDGLTVGGYVRRQRLEHCRADLANPHLSDWSVGRVGARWGFSDPAVFGRAFKAAYGVAPGEYRRRRL